MKQTNRSPKKASFVKAFTLFLTVILLLSSFAACTPSGNQPQDAPPKSDEELIRERIELFLESYNNGDMETVMECLDTKTRLAFQALLNIAGGIVGGVTGVDINLADLFTLGVNTTSGDFMGLTISSISISESGTAVATTSMSLPGAGTQTIYFQMVYENGGWYISDMTDAMPSGGATGTPDQDGGIAVVPKNTEAFSNGLGKVKYVMDGKEYYGVFNKDGKVIYSMEKREASISIESLGNETAMFVRSLGSQSKEYFMVNADGIVASWTNGEFDSILGAGDGLCMVYRRRDYVDRVEHFYGILNSNGEWVQPMKDLGYGWESYAYRGSGVFMVQPQAWRDPALFFDSRSGESFYIEGREASGIKFVNGVSFVTNPYANSVIFTEDAPKGEKLPDYCLLYSDGSYEAYDMKGKHLKNYENGYLCYSLENDTQNTYVVDITNPNASPIVYNANSTNIVKSISVVGEYGLVKLKGTSGTFVTVIDKNGKEQFEPIRLDLSSDPFTGEVFKGYKNYDCCIGNVKGEIIVTKYSSIDCFFDGIAIASSSSDGWIYINTKGERIFETVTVMP